MPKKEDNLSYDDTDQRKYIDLISKKASPFHKKHYADVFLFSIGLALLKGIPPMKIKGKKLPNIPISALGKKIWVLNALAISDKNSHKALFEWQYIYDLGERYANAGVKELYKEVFEKAGDIYKKIEKWINDFE